MTAGCRSPSLFGDKKSKYEELGVEARDWKSREV